MGFSWKVRYPQVETQDYLLDGSKWGLRQGVTQVTIPNATGSERAVDGSARCLGGPRTERHEMAKSALRRTSSASWEAAQLLEQGIYATVVGDISLGGRGVAAGKA